MTDRDMGGGQGGGPNSSSRTVKHPRVNGQGPTINKNREIFSIKDWQVLSRTLKQGTGQYNEGQGYPHWGYSGEVSLTMWHSELNEVREKAMEIIRGKSGPSQETAQRPWDKSIPAAVQGTMGKWRVSLRDKRDREQGRICGMVVEKKWKKNEWIC